MAQGEVIGGDYLKSQVNKSQWGSDLVVTTGFRGRKLNPEQVASWSEVSSESNRGVVGSVGQAVAKAVLPRHLRAAGSAAVGAAVESKLKPWHTVKVEWNDGKQSLIKLPDDLWTHFALVLRAQQIVDTEASATVVVVNEQDDAPNVTDRAFDLAHAVLRKIPGKGDAIVESSADAADQLRVLASLRDTGVLTDEEFTAKKAEILARI